MTRFLLDTNIISEATKPQPNAAVSTWTESQRDRDLFISSISIAEIQRGILDMPAGRKRQALREWFDGDEGPRRLFPGRIFAFDEDAAMVWAQLMSDGRARGRPRNSFDMMLAAIAITQSCTFVTLNERDFGDVVAVVNPARSPV